MTGVALIAFLALALALSPLLCAKLIIWMFAIQVLMVLTSLGSFYFNIARRQDSVTAAKKISTGKRR